MVDAEDCHRLYIVADISEQGSHETTNVIKQAGVLALAVKCDVLQTEDVKNCL